jgi:hypothetical protein
MRQQPGPDELARLAAAILGDDKLPEDRSARSYEQRLAAKALSIAAYDREHAAVDRGEELADTVAAAASDDETRIAALNRRLATEIRAGDWDEPTDALKTLLMAQTRARLARTNPKYLKARLSKD